jgi:hypothetical protein
MRLAIGATIACAVVLAAGGCRDREGVSEEVRQEIQDKYQTYLSLATEKRGSHGWLYDDCDGLLFSSLSSWAGVDSSIGAAERSPGVWWRRPDSNCYPEESKSEISRDMIVGLVWWLYKHKKADDIREIFYVCRDDKYLGAGDESRTKCTPNILSTLSVAYRELTGKDLGYSRFPVTKTIKRTGYQVHLTGLLIAFRKHVTGELSKTNEAWLYSRLRYNPNNAILLTTWGDGEGAGEVLLREDLFPQGRLPSSEDRCEPWVWQREESEWKPCAGEKHRGGDFLFAAQLLLGD